MFSFVVGVSARRFPNGSRTSGTSIVGLLLFFAGLASVVTCCWVLWDVPDNGVLLLRSLEVSLCFTETLATDLDPEGATDKGCERAPVQGVFVGPLLDDGRLCEVPISAARAFDFV